MIFSLIHITDTDYRAMAYELSGIEESKIEYEYMSTKHECRTPGGLLIITFSHKIGCKAGVGYDLEMTSIVHNEEYSIVDWGCYDEDGMPVKCDFDESKLLGILN